MRYPCLILSVVLTMALLILPGAVRADMGGLFNGGAIFAAPTRALVRPRGALVQIRQPAGDVEIGQGQSSLFIGQAGRSLFAPRLSDTGPAALAIPALAGTPVERLRQLIGHAESRRHGYDAVQYGARIKPAKNPTAMTVGEIFQWIDETPGQPHAIGRFQFIPPTLRRLVRRLNVRDDQVFSPRLQDRLADVLLIEAGYNAMRAGDMTRRGFMANLAKIWAGLPTSNGKSHYHGYAGNKASITWAQYDAEMTRIFPG